MAKAVLIILYLVFIICVTNEFLCQNVCTQLLSQYPVPTLGFCPSSRFSFRFSLSGKKISVVTLCHSNAAWANSLKMGEKRGEKVIKVHHDANTLCCASLRVCRRCLPSQKVFRRFSVPGNPAKSSWSMKEKGIFCWDVR